MHICGFTSLALLCARLLCICRFFIILSIGASISDVWRPLQSEQHVEALRILNILFTVAFAIEAAMKLFGLGICLYFSDRWNCFDFVLVLTSFIDELASFGDIDPVYFRVLRLLRVARLLRFIRLIRGVKQIVRQINTLYLSLPALANVLALEMLLCTIYAIAGVSLFRDTKPAYAAILTPDNPYVGFQNFAIAFLTLVRCITGESWNGIMRDLMISDKDNPGQCSLYVDGPRTCTDSPLIVAVYFCSFTLFATFMLLNLLIGIVLQNFSDSLDSSDQCISEEMIDTFRGVWYLFDPHGTNRIPVSKLAVLLQVANVHGWIFYPSKPDKQSSLRESKDLLKKLDLTIHKPSSVEGEPFLIFSEVLHAIAIAIHHRFDSARHSEVCPAHQDSYATGPWPLDA